MKRQGGGGPASRVAAASPSLPSYPNSFTNKTGGGERRSGFPPISIQGITRTTDGKNSHSSHGVQNPSRAACHRNTPPPWLPSARGLREQNECHLQPIPPQQSERQKLGRGGEKRCERYQLPGQAILWFEKSPPSPSKGGTHFQILREPIKAIVEGLKSPP